jgi:7-cyano-7-deazaguanine synthase
MSQESMVLMSGGPDSFAAAKWAKISTDNVTGVFFDAGHEVAQREYELFEKQTSYLDIKSDSIQIRDVIKSLGDDITGPEHVFKGHGLELFPFSSGIVSSLAISYAASHNIDSIVFGLHNDDFQQSDEYTPEVLESIFNSPCETVADVGVKIPFKDKSKSGVIEQGHEWGVPLQVSWSCTQSNHQHCGECEQCIQRREAFGPMSNMLEESDDMRPEPENTWLPNQR